MYRQRDACVVVIKKRFVAIQLSHGHGYRPYPPSRLHVDRFHARDECLGGDECHNGTTVQKKSTPHCHRSIAYNLILCMSCQYRIKSRLRRDEF